MERAVEARDTASEPWVQVCEDLTGLAAFVCGTPAAQAFLVGHDGRVFCPEPASPWNERVRAASFYSLPHTTGQPLILHDASQDSRFAADPLVSGPPGVRFFAGLPVLAEGAASAGMLCVVDTAPRTLSERQLALLTGLARQASQLFRRPGLLAENSRLEAEAATFRAEAERSEERLQHMTEERRLGAERLQLESERLHMSLATTNATSFEWVPDTDAVRWSGLAPFGVDPLLIPTGTASLEYVLPEDHAGLIAVLERARLDGQPYSHEFRVLWSDGSTRWMRTAGRAFHNAAGATRFLGVNTDVTERRLAEEALLQTEKLAAVGRMASVISHEINNPLEAVTNLLYIVRSSPSLSREDREHLELADRELSRVSQITAQALRFHRNGSNVVEIDADILVQELLSLYRTRLSASDIRVRLDLQEEVRFQAHEGEIRQVLNNLVGNAFDAMRQGGKLIIRSRYSTDSKTGRQGVSITIADNGGGIPPAARDRVFEAFYSTKGINGTGLGLWISSRILDKHGGRLTFRTSCGLHHGTAFRLWLPVRAVPTAAEHHA